MGNSILLYNTNKPTETIKENLFVELFLQATVMLFLLHFHGSRSSEFYQTGGRERARKEVGERGEERERCLTLS